MHLAAGARLGPYEVVGLLGAGGVGEVYRARDSRLGREVAVKVLPNAVTADPDRLRRFEQEARAASALDHPNILIIHDVGRHEGRPYVVAELLEGRTLRDALRSGGLTIRKAVEYAVQIAQGLAAAHEKGIVHRDLKPENLFLTRDGRIKILDFGLARLHEEPGAVLSEGAAATVTGPNVVLGTAAYMSPEQVRGEPVDHRSDIFSFGSVLFELLSRTRPFRGTSGAETATAILGEDPPELTSLAEGVPAPLDRLVRRCLEKRREDRFQSARDIAFALEIEAAQGPAATQREAHRPRRIATILMTSALAALIGWQLAPRAPTRPHLPRQFVIELAADAPFEWGKSYVPFTLSSDGRKLVYGALGPGIVVRSLNELDSRPIGGVGSDPFLSPDGDWVAFWASATLYKTPLSGGSRFAICRADALLGGSWTSDGDIVFAPDEAKGLYRVSDQGGTAEELTRVDSAAGEVGHRWPQVLPGNRSAVFTIRSKTGDGISALSLTTRARRAVLEGGSYARYVPTGHLVYARDSALYAVPFDPERLATSGTPVRVLDGVAMDPRSGGAWFSIAADGTLAFLPAPKALEARALVWVDRKGVRTPITATRGPFVELRVSPDGRRIAAMHAAAWAIPGDIWVLDLLDDTLRPLTSGGATGGFAWSPDGDRLAYRARHGSFEILAQPTHGIAPPEPLLTVEGKAFVGSWSPDGRTLFANLYAVHPGELGEIYALPLNGQGQPRPIVQTPANEFFPQVSPDGRWLTYLSNQTGRDEIFVIPTNGSSRALQISTEGGVRPRWARAGNELYYVKDRSLWAVPIQTGARLVAGKPFPLLKDVFAGEITDYDVGADGRFVVIEPGQDEAHEARVIHVIVDWFEELRRRVPAGS